MMNVAEITHQPPFSAGLWRSDSSASTWVGEAESYSTVAANRLLETMQVAEDSGISLEIMAFGSKLVGKIVDVQFDDEYRHVTFEASVETGVTAVLKIRTERSNAEADNLQIREASLSFRVSEYLPKPLFITDTLYAILGLAGPVRISIPEVRLDFTLHFDVRLSELSRLLQRRQLYFGLMVIEKATGRTFDVPEYISGEEMSAIFFSSRAILESNFIWRVNEIVVPTPANEETFRWFHSLESLNSDQFVYRLVFGPSPESRLIFGQEVTLGSQTVFIEDGVIQDHQDVGEALSRMDGRIVAIRIKPLSRLGRYTISNGPRLNDEPWDKRIQYFVDLERMLGQSLVARYLGLMSLVVPELPPEQVYALINPETFGVLAEQARERNMPVDEYLKGLLHQIEGFVQPLHSSEVEFEAAMEGFSEGTEHLLPHSGTYSRDDIYFDHD